MVLNQFDPPVPVQVSRYVKWLASVGQFFEQSIPIGNVQCVRAFQSPKKHLCGGRIVAASLQPSDHLALMGDVLLPTMEKAFGVSKKLFQGGAVHPAA
jgi:hypothetical protein